MLSERHAHTEPERDATTEARGPLPARRAAGGREQRPRRHTKSSIETQRYHDVCPMCAVSTSQAHSRLARAAKLGHKRTHGLYGCGILWHDMTRIVAQQLG